MRMGQPSQRHDRIVWETEMTEPTCQQLMLKWEKGREKHEGPVCGLSNHVRRIRHGGGCDGVSEQSGRFHSQQPETQQAARGTRSSWCPGLTAVSEVPGAEAGTGPLAQRRAGGQTTCLPLDPPPLAPASPTQGAACSPPQEPPRAPATGLRSHVSARLPVKPCLSCY